MPPTSTIAPWLPVRDAATAAVFYQSAFDATEVYRLEDPRGGLVLRLSVGGAEFWLSSEPSAQDDTPPSLPGPNNIRMILTVSDPDTMFAAALNAGAAEVFPVGEGHGWRLGRLTDPFGLDWEIGRPL